MSELMSAQDVQNALGQLALREATTKEQMGVLVEDMKSERIARLALDSRESSHYEEFLQYQEKQRQKERVDEAAAKEYGIAISNRITDLLSERNRFDLFGSFSKKCWIDAKKHSYMVGKHGMYTKQMYHTDVINYIGTWEPYGWGVDGYIEHLDSMKNGN